MTNSKGHGGKRKGAGSKKKTPVGAKRRQILMTDEELEYVLALLEKLRSQKSEKI